ncbi:hypothetical protein BO94DRAFT_537668 [Aspergillus sclerotioniger CBS 115572]|uniref:Uncharacterized protein n=1 Tax=Aspergillus sclerotioniger CBS 115572 TaxID=1450535 RepID=A0A317VZP3_9EURO|nr:hypothetical protein BO94DRAFT_537668 [Aspergillus sclerotioniger CBS 115572]PWY78482.1 hypothetical protein BO94DRAFT_537668 [Aspergillus sclerotioniger CBS 115572]
MAEPPLHFFSILYRELSYAFIHSTGHDPLIARANRFIQTPAPNRNAHRLIPIGLGILAKVLIRYIISHVVLSILILETAEQQTNTSKPGDNKSSPSSRQLLRTTAVFYHKGGLRLLLNGIGSACTYWLMHTSVTKISTTLLPHPIAHILTSVLLAESHFFWTARTILPPDQLRLVPNPHDYQRWKALIPATLVYATSEIVMMLVSGLFDVPLPVTTTGLSWFVGSDVLRYGLVLAVQMFLIFPAYILLIMVQGSLLPPTCETLVFAQLQRGRRVGEIFSGEGGVGDVVKMLGVKQLLWCLELHGKMGLCLVGVAAVVHSVVYSLV